MTFTYACLSQGGIVLAADSQVTFVQHKETREVVGTYLGERSKIRRINGHTAYSTAGTGGFADALVEAVELNAAASNAASFDDAIKQCRQVFLDELLKRNFNQPPPVSFLFCGYSNVQGALIPKRVILSSGNYFNYWDVDRFQPAWTGAIEHGAALYLHHRFHPKERLLSLQQAKLLAYCIVKEVAEQDNTVGGPIEMEVITESGSSPFADIEAYEEKRQQIISYLRTLVS